MEEDLVTHQKPAREVEVEQQCQHVRQCKRDWAGGEPGVALHQAQQHRHREADQCCPQHAAADTAQQTQRHTPPAEPAAPPPCPSHTTATSPPSPPQASPSSNPVIDSRLSLPASIGHVGGWACKETSASVTDWMLTASASASTTGINRAS